MDGLPLVINRLRRLPAAWKTPHVVVHDEHVEPDFVAAEWAPARRRGFDVLLVERVEIEVDRSSIPVGVEPGTLPTSDHDVFDGACHRHGNKFQRRFSAGVVVGVAISREVRLLPREGAIPGFSRSFGWHEPRRASPKARSLPRSRVESPTVSRAIALRRRVRKLAFQLSAERRRLHNGALEDTHFEKSAACARFLLIFLLVAPTGFEWPHRGVTELRDLPHVVRCADVGIVPRSYR